MTPFPIALRIGRWVLLLGLLGLALYFLNDFAFSAWLAGGPPGDHKLGWERRSQASLALSVASMLAAVAAFWAMAQLPKVSRALLVVMGLSAILAVAPFVAREVLIDKCLDSGGRWNNSAIECEH